MTIQYNLLFALLAILPGLAAGRFLNHLVHRILHDLPLLSRHSICEVCKESANPQGHPTLMRKFIVPYRCGKCGRPLHWRVPVIEILSALGWSWSVYRYPLPEAVLFILMVSCLLVISFVDLEIFIIPLFMIITAAVSLILWLLIFNPMWTFALWGLVTGVGYLGGMMLLTSLIFRKQTMGFGDVQLIAVLGAWVGVFNILATILLAAVLSLIAWILVSAWKGFSRNRPLPFGPFLSAGAVLLYMLDLDWQAILDLLI